MAVLNIKQLHNLAKSYDKLTGLAAAEALRFYKNRFVEQNFIDHGTQTWKKPRFRPRALAQTGALKRSVRLTYISRSPTGALIRIGTDKPQAKINNEGGKITITPKMRKFFWAKHYEASGALGEAAKAKGGRKRSNARSRSLNSQAEYYKALALKKGTITIPKRQFIGPSATLERQINRVLKAAITNIIKK